jgi:hypothetical protein
MTIIGGGAGISILRVFPHYYEEPEQMQEQFPLRMNPLKDILVEYNMLRRLQLNYKSRI